MSEGKRIIGCDPGPERSAYAILDDGVPGAHAWLANDHLLKLLPALTASRHLAIETLQPRAEPVSRDAMQAQFWAGRFVQVATGTFQQVCEFDGRFAATGNPKATTAHLRIGLHNIFGEDRKAQCPECVDGRVPGKRAGTMKKCERCNGNKSITVPGPLADFGEHERCALAAALYVQQSTGARTP